MLNAIKVALIAETMETSEISSDVSTATQRTRLGLVFQILVCSNVLSDCFKAPITRAVLVQIRVLAVSTLNLPALLATPPD